MTSAEQAPPPRSHVLLGAILDPDSYRSWDLAGDERRRPPDPDYRAVLARASARAGVDEAVLTGEGRLRGRQVAVVCSEFAFLAGSIGVHAAERVIRAVERATAERLPLIAAPASGGTRMQEGTPAFLRMAAIANALTAHKRAGLPYIVYLRDPTTGGVLASWGSLGHVTFAEPGALIGFLGPKVHAALRGERLPAEVQTAENLHAHGLVDAVLSPERFADVAGRLLSLHARRLNPAGGMPRRLSAPVQPPRAWAAVAATRRHDRPGVADLVRWEAADTVMLGGAGQGEAKHGMLVCVTRFGSASCVLVGQDRQAQLRAPMGVDALRAARRGMRLAAGLGLPLVTVIDTPGAALSRSEEEAGLARQIARCLAELGALPTATVSIMLGQGCGGAALALLPADVVIAARNGWLSPLPPEGASVILHGVTDHAPQLAAAQRIRAEDLRLAGAVDRIVDETPDAAEAPRPFLRRVAAAIEDELTHATSLPAAERVARRVSRYRQVGAVWGDRAT